MQTSKKHLGQSFGFVLLLASACAVLVTLMSQLN